jgi:hypothetical protein
MKIIITEVVEGFTATIETDISKCGIGASKDEALMDLGFKFPNDELPADAEIVE